MIICWNFTHTHWPSKVKMGLFLHGNRFGEFSITSLAHQWILCSEWVPSESKQLKKHHNNPQVIHTTPVHQLMSCVWSQKLHVCKKQIHHFNFRQSLLVIMYNNTSVSSKSSKKSIPCCPLTSKIHTHTCLELFWLVNGAWSVHISLLIQMRWLFHWRMQYYG